MQKTGYDLRISAWIYDVCSSDLFFPTDPANPDKDSRGCLACGAVRLGLRLGRNGGFIGCSNYPDCRYTRPLAVPGNEEDNGVELTNPQVLGSDPETGKAVTLRNGPSGIHLQLSEAAGDGQPQRASLPTELAPSAHDTAKSPPLPALPRHHGSPPN